MFQLLITTKCFSASSANPYEGGPVGSALVSGMMIAAFRELVTISGHKGRILLSSAM